MEILPHPPEVAAKRLLSDAKLPAVDITAEQLIHFFGCWSEEELVGVIGLEFYGNVALLRSLVVAPSRQGWGFGPALVAHAEEYAATHGVRAIYLLTTTAEEYFKLLGYSRARREEAPAAIRGTEEFAHLCPISSAFMVKYITANHSVNTDTADEAARAG